VNISTVDSESGRLDFDGFQRLMLKYYKNSDDVQTELLQAFMVFDKDKSGGIDKEELRQVYTLSPVCVVKLSKHRIVNLDVATCRGQSHVVRGSGSIVDRFPYFLVCR
jgi:Ca2+-binding EF-hand superfamily protein